VWRILVALAAAAFVVGALTVAPSIAAGGLLHPARHSVSEIPPGCANKDFEGDGITLRGWQCQARGKRRGTVVYLHGIADNRGSSSGTIDRFTRNAFDVVAYDSRRHGDSGGEVCTYGFLEKRDLRRVVDTLPRQPVVLVGTSLGAAVALQEAAADPRITAIVAAESFSDLRTAAAGRAPWFLPAPVVRKAFVIAEQRGGFLVDAVSPMEAARSIRAPVLLIHGAEDRETPPSHSQRIFEALAGPRRLILVPGAGHNQSLSGPQVWVDIDRWIQESLELSEKRFAMRR
jgi:pimeloyl-ACP methyl ester carboxylesterase